MRIHSEGMPFPFRPGDKTQFDRMKILLRLLRGGGDKSRRMVLLSILDLGVSPRSEKTRREKERKRQKAHSSRFTRVTLKAERSSVTVQRHDDVLSITFLPSALIFLLIRFTRVQV